MVRNRIADVALVSLMSLLCWSVPPFALRAKDGAPAKSGASAQDGASAKQQPATQQSAAAQKPPTVQEQNDAFVQKLTKQIAGHEQEPAAQVFKNIQLENLKKIPAARLLLIMNLGYSHALGVTCTHCHAEDDFSKDDKRPKRAAREMATMHRGINEQLNKMENLLPNPKGHFINCGTCHRGNINPNAGQ